MNEFERRLLDTVQNSTWIAAVARPNAKILGIDYYNYNVTISNVASAASKQGIIQIQSDSDFAIAYMSGAAVDMTAGLINTTPVTTVQLTDTGTGKTFFYQPTLFNLVFGAGGLPFYLPAPRVVAPNTNLQFDITNLISTHAQDYYINLLGARIYY